jgi:hypothetical protein
MEVTGLERTFWFLTTLAVAVFGLFMFVYPERFSRWNAQYKLIFLPSRPPMIFRILGLVLIVGSAVSMAFSLMVTVT